MGWEVRIENDQIGIVVGKITSFATTLCCRKKYIGIQYCCTYVVWNVPFFGNACGKTSCGENWELYPKVWILRKSWPQLIP